MSSPKRINLGGDQIGVDRLGNLPEVLLSEILSFLPTKDSVATSILSTKWKYIWTTVSKLHFTDSCFTTKLRGKYQRHAFIAFLNTVIPRCNPSLVHEFRLECTLLYAACHLHRWISAAMRLTPQIIHIRSTFAGRLALPTSFAGLLVFPNSLYSCVSLEELDLHIKCTLKIPSSFYFANLRILKLYFVQVLNEDLSVSSELNFSLPVLELLSFELIQVNPKVINIDAPKLNKFYLNGLNDCVVKINAPSLEEFSCYHCLLVDFIMLCPPSVTRATIQFHSHIIRQAKLGFLTYTFLRQLRSLKYLTLPPEAIEAMKEVIDLHDHLPTLTNLIHLTITFGTPVSIGMLVTLLNASPVLETLIFSPNYFYSHNDEVVQAVLPCSHYHLKTVIFMEFCWTKLEVEVAKYLLKNAMILEEMSITSESSER